MRGVCGGEIRRALFRRYHARFPRGIRITRRRRFAVHQIRLFKGVETEIRDMEKEINSWLKESKARIVQMSANIAPQTNEPAPTGVAKSRQYAPSDLFVALVYDM